ELVVMKELNEIEDHKITIVGPDLNEAKDLALATYVEVAGKKMQVDFESVIERKFHAWFNYMEGVMHTGQRNQVRVRVSNAAYEAGVRVKDFAEVLYVMIMNEFDAVVDKCQVTIITDAAEAAKFRDEIAMPRYAQRDDRLASMTDESVDRYYTWNKRDTELLVTKHNEALKLMPELFEKNGYQVTVSDPPYANYSEIPDLSIFDEYPNMNTFITGARFTDPALKAQVVKNSLRNFFCFSVMKSMPLAAQPTIYNNGNYNQAKSSAKQTYSTQNAQSTSVASGISNGFMACYNVLANLSNITKVTDEEKNTFMIFTNNTSHEPTLLQTPDYVPAMQVDNTAYDAANTDRFTANGKTMKVDDINKMQHYHSNMATFKQLGAWFDDLRKQGVYDNTRIILVADHGRGLDHFDELTHELESGRINTEVYYPLLMVKDFGSTEFTTSDKFMTNADVPTLATEGIIENPVNPFTGKAINSDEKTAHDQYMIISGKWRITENNGKTYLPAFWASVKDNLWDPDNWAMYKDEDVVLKEHAFPKK
ncbi:MAG: hypothetical protein IIW40_00720, partial [Clostridia bacterium]|nr:hypothetical protein [Clostridia bacterium]